MKNYSKNINYKSISAIFFMGLIMFLSSCYTTNISLEVLIPAQINIPPHIKKVAVINHSLPAKGEGFTNFLEGFITGESIHADKEASNNCLNGLIAMLNSYPRINAVLINYPQIKGTGTKDWPVPISWTMIDSLCKMYNSDAIIALETFDSDIFFNSGSEVIRQKIKDKDTSYTEYFSDLKINIDAGWRIYDKANKTIVDENSFIDEKGWRTSGKSPEEALHQLPNKRTAINNAGLFAGNLYGKRISPNWINVNRMYYTRCKKENGFKMAKKWLKQNNWEQALIIWNNLSKSSDKKVAGRALYNLALKSEMDGNLEQALEYIKKSVENSNSSEAKEYMYAINNRIADQEKLKEQMKK